MSERFPGGFITKAPVAPTPSAASGIWTIDQALQYIKAGTWPLPKYDPYFNYVTALLTGDGVNNAQNNTFLDSSTNNYTITRNGNTTQGTFSPFSQNGWSNALNGGYLYFTNSTGLGSNNFTIEFWGMDISGSGDWGFFSVGGTSGSDFAGVTMHYTGGIYISTTGSSWQYTNFGGLTFSTDGQWHHYAIVRNGNSVLTFKDGSLIATTAITGTIVNNAGQTRIGSKSNATGSTNGWVSNFRVVNGTALYTASFTPSTSPLTAVANTAVLTCQANRFLDASTNAFAITLSGAPSVQAFSPFNPTSAWSASATGGSGYFDGSGDYLTGTAPNLSGTWTVEFWWYPTAGIATQQSIVSFNAGSNTGINIWCNTSGQLVVDDGANAQTAFSTVTFKANQWNHVAIVRSGTTTTGYINGAVAGSNTFTPQTTNSISVGRYNSATAYYVSGFVSDVRVVNGTAVYTAAFTPPTAPLTAITNTQVLLNFTNAGIYDWSANADYETVADAKVSTSVVKYGTGSMAFDGTGDYLPSTSNQGFQLGTGDFTIEGWAYFTSTANKGVLQISTTAGGLYGGTANTIALAFYNAGTHGWILYANGTSYYLGTTVDVVNSWNHFAIVRVSSTTRLYINGMLQITVASDTTNYTGTYLCVGGYYSGTYLMAGYIDDLRITKGVGRYPYTFSPPTSSYPVTYGGTPPTGSDPYFRYTALLLPGNGTNGAQNNTFLDSSTNNFTITRNGNTTQGNFSPFSQTGWGNYFGGSGNYLTIADATQFDLSGGSYTIECWIYPTGDYGNYNTIIAKRGGACAWEIYLRTSTGVLSFFNGTNYESPITPSANQWHHVAAVYDGTNINLYLDGNRVYRNTMTNSNTAASIYIGTFPTYDERYIGHISNMRITKGAALYTGNSFTVPTTALTTSVSAGTVSLLTCQSNRFRDASTNNAAITLTGTPSVQAFSPFAPTDAWSASTNGGSGYFDGSGDYLAVPSNSVMNFGTGDFTVEAWVYPTATPSDGGGPIGGASGNILLAYQSASGQWSFGRNFVAWDFSSLTAPVLNAWTHLAVSRSGTTIRYFVNGVLTNSATNSTSYTLAGGGNIGFNGASGIFTGYITNVRAVGSAVYTAAFTPPTAPLTAITNTQLLLSATNGAIVDATAKNDLETVGNAQISTTQSKFGGSSMYFDGTGDWLALPASQNLTFGTGDFTIELWVYAGAQGGTGARMMGNGNGAAWGSGKWVFTTYAAEGYKYQFNWWNYTSGTGAGLLSTTSSNNSTWTHIAVTRYGNTFSLFVNGIKEATASNSSSLDNGTASPIRVGSGGVSGDTEWVGYIDDLRITKGIARYTSNFTPPTSAFLTQ